MPDPHPSDAPDTSYRPWLHRFAYLVVLTTFSLIAIGGKVTSYDVGMAVPDGFTTFGHFPLFAPLSKWWNEFGTRWEHTHRLMGNLVGMLTIAIAIWLWCTQSARPWLKQAGFAMLILVIGQGVMGALRVQEISITLAFVHGIFGQLILCSWIVVAAALSQQWITRLATIRQKTPLNSAPILRWAVRILLVMLIGQLTLGAAVRHFKADKAIPDFPLHYGHVMPPMSQDKLDQVYLESIADQMGITTQEATELNLGNRSPQGEIVVPVSAVHLHFSHRLWGYCVTLFSAVLLIGLWRSKLSKQLVTLPALMFAGLIVLQICLGVMTVFSGTDPVIATAHQATGALLIATATWLAVRVHLAQYDLPPAPQPSPSPANQTAAAPALQTRPA